MILVKAVFSRIFRWEKVLLFNDYWLPELLSLARYGLRDFAQVNLMRPDADVFAQSQAQTRRRRVVCLICG
jgi:hypothetical protein